MNSLRNIAIVAHVDHGKTTLVSRLMEQTETGKTTDTIQLDNNALEKERGITILAKNTSINWDDTKINLVDTPGHADFSGEVERILSMVDAVLVVVDSVEGPMPQTRYVTEMALSNNLYPIVVVNKCDRPTARPFWVLDQTFELFMQLGANDTQLDFPSIFCSATEGYARFDPNDKNENMDILLDTIKQKVPAPISKDGPFQMQISALDYSDYVGTIGIGKVIRGKVTRNIAVEVLSGKKKSKRAKINDILSYSGLERVLISEAQSGDIIAVTGISDLKISDTICALNHPEPLQPLKVEEPTITVTVDISDSPFAAVEGTSITSRQIIERLEKEIIHNVALRIELSPDTTQVLVSGRGELHLSVLFETMRREGFAFCVGKPQAIVKNVNGIEHEPYERVIIDVAEEHKGKVMEQMGNRGGHLKDISVGKSGENRLDYLIPSRSLMGYRTEFLTATAGSGRINTRFESYQPTQSSKLIKRSNGVLISKETGKALAFSIFNLQNRGKILISPGEKIFEGMIIGIHSRDNDLVVNPLKGKQLTNVRAVGSDENIQLIPPITFTLEQALEFIEEDELVDVAPHAIRVRKKILRETDRKKNRSSK